MELSSATSQVRALEHTVFEKESAVHKLQTHVARLEEQLAQLRAGGAPSRLSGLSPRPASRALGSDADDLRRASFGARRGSPQPPPALPRALFGGQNMSAETLHKRKVSLSMLKARIESEAPVVAAAAVSRALSPVQSEGAPSRGHSRASSAVAGHRPHGHGHGHGHRPQFLDESHVFWCHACQGDLVIL